MKLIVGLGNYPKKYDFTRHNIGFLTLDFLSSQYKFGKWTENKKMLCDITDGILFGYESILIKPRTYMNLSGQSVIKVKNFFKILSQNIIVIHDDIDIAFGKIKISSSRNSAGHNGVKSINSVINDPYIRIRIGVGRPEGKEINIANYVLEKFSEEELKNLHNIFTEVDNKLQTLQPEAYL